MSDSYTYTNWREKTFIIDEEFAAKLQEDLIEDGCTKEEAEVMTPERLFEMLPDLERWQRHFDLEEMWEKPNA